MLFRSLVFGDNEIFDTCNMYSIIVYDWWKINAVCIVIVSLIQ